MKAAAAAVLVADAVMAFGFVVGFNQLGTQSPVDAILPVALIAVGVTGLVTLVAALLGHRPAANGSETAEHEAGPRALAPPTLDQGFAAFGLGLVAIASVGWRWGVTAQAAIVAAQGIALLLAAERGVVQTLRDDPARPATYRLCLLTPQAVLLVGFAWAALADAGIRPFS